MILAAKRYAAFWNTGEEFHLFLWLSWKRMIE
jgi:hypothetical protein